MTSRNISGLHLYKYSIFGILVFGGGGGVNVLQNEHVLIFINENILSEIAKGLG